MKVKGKYLKGNRYSNTEFEVRPIVNPEGQLVLFVISADGAHDIFLEADDILREIQRLGLI